MDLDYKSDPNIWIWIEFGLDYPKLNPWPPLGMINDMLLLRFPRLMRLSECNKIVNDWPTSHNMYEG